MARVTLDLRVPDPSKFQQALDEARGQGLSVSRSFADLGMISGSIESKALGKLVHIDGVASVAPDRRPRISREDGGTVVPFGKHRS